MARSRAESKSELTSFARRVGESPIRITGIAIASIVLVSASATFGQGPARALAVGRMRMFRAWPSIQHLIAAEARDPCADVRERADDALDFATAFSASLLHFR